MGDLPVSKKQRLKLDLKAAHIALREVSKHAEGETRRADGAEAERDAFRVELEFATAAPTVMPAPSTWSDHPDYPGEAPDAS